MHLIDLYFLTGHYFPLMSDALCLMWILSPQFPTTMINALGVLWEIGCPSHVIAVVEVM